MKTLTAGQAEDGDVVLAPDHQVYQYAGDGQWLAMQPAESGPPGQLLLLVRGGEELQQ